MKKKFKKYKVTLGLLFSFLYVTSVGQTLDPATCPARPNANIGEYCENGHGISTDPSDPVNPDCSELTNNFDWKLRQTNNGTLGDENYTVYDGDNTLRQLRNPFGYFGSVNVDYQHIANGFNSNYYPEDGWELLKVAYGTVSNIGLGPNVNAQQNTDVTGPMLPYMILYNKYSGTFRFFGALLTESAVFETVRIELRIPSESPNNAYDYQPFLKATNLLSVQGETVQPLDEETKETSLVVFTQATNNTNVPFWFDIPVAYDPCLCNIRSQLDITFSFVQTADIQITGGPIPKPAFESNGSGNASKVVPRIFAAVLSTAVAVKTGGTVINFKAYADLIGLASGIPGLSQTQKDALKDLKDFVACSGNFAKVVKANYEGAQSLPSGNNKKVTSTEKASYAAAEKLLDGTTTFASALSNGCAGDDKSGTTVSGAFVAKGTYTQTADFSDTEIRLAMPGSKWSDKQVQENVSEDNGNLFIPAYPTYNERLGTFALLEKPEIKVSYRGELSSQSFQSFSQVPGVMNQFYDVKGKVYRIDPVGTLKYVFNPILNVDLEESQIEFRFVTKQNLDVQNTGLSLHGVSFKPRNVLKNDNLMYNVTTPFLPIEYYETFGPIILPIEESSFVQSYVSGQPVYLTEEQPFFNYTDSLFIQFKILMTSEDEGREGKNQAYYFFTYPIKVTEEVDVQDNLLPPPNPPITEAELNWWAFENNRRKLAAANTFTSSSPALSGGNFEYNQDIIFPDDDVLFYDGLVEISVKMSTTGGKKVTIYSTLGFELLPGAEIGSNIELIIGYPFVSNPIPPQTYQQVSTFCGDNNKYKAQEFAAAAIQQEKQEYERRAEAANKLVMQKNAQNLYLSLYPNPTNGVYTVRFDFAIQNLEITVLDVNGKEVSKSHYNGEHLQVSLDATQLEAGVYFIDVRDANGKIGRQRLVKY